MSSTRHSRARDAFHDLYLAEYRKLYETQYASGRALQELDRLEHVLACSDAIDHAAMEAEVSDLRAMVESRRDGLVLVLAEEG